MASLGVTTWSPEMSIGQRHSGRRNSMDSKREMQRGLQEALLFLSPYLEGAQRGVRCPKVPPALYKGFPSKSLKTANPHEKIASGLSDTPSDVNSE